MSGHNPPFGRSFSRHHAQKRARGVPRPPLKGLRFHAQNGISSSMSLLARAPAATARRGGALEGPLEPKSPPASSPPKLPPPLRPSLRPSSMVSVELKSCSTTSVEYFSTPC